MVDLGIGPLSHESSGAERDAHSKGKDVTCQARADELVMRKRAQAVI